MRLLVGAHAELNRSCLWHQVEIRSHIEDRHRGVALGIEEVQTVDLTVNQSQAVHVNMLLGAESPSAAALDAWPGIFSTFAIVLLIPGVGGAWEEPGWRGYAVPRLQSGRSALVASLILAVLIAGWHLPLMVVGQVYYSDIVLIVAAVIVFNWVFNNAKGSVLIIMLMHAANNAAFGFFSPMFSGADSISQSWLLALVWVVVAGLVIAIAGPTNLSRKHHRQQEPVPDAEPESVGPIPKDAGA